MKKTFKHIILSLMGIGLLTGIGLTLTRSVQTIADDANGTDFESFILGDVHGQDGWRSDSDLNYDVAVVANTYGYLSFGTKSLRISNAVTRSSFGDQTFSKALVDEAGETSASSSVLTTGTRQPYFEAQWDFASAVPLSEQVGLSMSISPNRLDILGAGRMSYLQIQDISSGLKLNFIDYQGSPTTTGITTAIATGLDRTIPHTVKITMQFIDGASNDIVKVFLDGTLIHTGTSWEDYYPANEPTNDTGGLTHPVDSILFRHAGPAVPANLGNGFLIDNFSSLSGPVPTPANPIPTLSTLSPSSKTKGDVAFTLTVTGTDFVSNSFVNFNNSPRSTIFVNSGQLTASIVTNDLAVATSSVLITVTNPAPGGGTSNSQVFTVNNPQNGGGGGFSPGGGQSFASYNYGPAPDILIPVPAPELTPALISQIQTQLTTLLAELKALITQMKASGLNVPSSAKLLINDFVGLFTRNLTLNSTGEDVRLLQQFLNSRGYIVSTQGSGSPGNETSFFGNATRTAVINFQRDNNIQPPSGFFGPITRAFIESLSQ